MASAVDRMKDWWEGKAPRERTLLAVLGATLVLCSLIWVGMTIRGGLSAIENKNDRTREALKALDLHRRLGATQKAKAPTVTIPSRAVELDSYLEPIVQNVELASPTYPQPKETQKEQFTELSIRVAFKGLTIYQVKDLLEQVETKNPLVVVTELHVKQGFGDSETLDVEMTVATYYKKPAPGAAAGGEG